MRMNWQTFILLLLFCTGLLAFADATELSGTVSRETAKDWGEIFIADGYKLSNNVWNKQAAQGRYQQRVFAEFIEGNPAIGWEWQWSGQNEVLAYPEVIYGNKPWEPPNNAAVDLPFAVCTKDVMVDYNILYHKKTSGIFNMAFSMWVVNEVPKAEESYKDKITNEIMIWIDNHGLRPAGFKIDTVEINGASFDVYKKENHGDSQNTNRWTYIAFAPQQALLHGPLNLTGFLDYLINKGIVTKDRYVADIELGNEIVSGQGLVEIKDYSVQIHDRF